MIIACMLCHGRIDIGDTQAGTQVICPHCSTSVEVLEVQLCPPVIREEDTLDEQFKWSYLQYLQSIDPETIDLWPAWELVPIQQGESLDLWEERWRAACVAAGEDWAWICWLERRRMVARKDSALWQHLSSFGLPYPPFDAASPMAVEDVARSDAIRLGAISARDRLRPVPKIPPPQRAD